MTETIVSGIAAILTTVAFVPQAYKIIQSRRDCGCIVMDARHVCRGRSILVRARSLDRELADDNRKRRNVHSDSRHCQHEALSQVTYSLFLPARGQRDRSVCFEHGKANVG
jgi:hypothetical protein